MTGIRTSAAALLLASLVACGGGGGGDTAGQAEPEECVQIDDVTVGEGDEAVTGSVVTVHYTGTLEDGTEFDSSRGRGPFEFALGANQVIQGWEEGIPGMRVGGTRVLTICPDAGYGEAGAGGVIPPNATLIFEVELLEVESPA